MRIRPATFREASAFVALLHRHNKPPRGMKFAIKIVDDDSGDTIGVAMVGRPVSREEQNRDGDVLTCEVNRTCTDQTPNANSMLYGASWRVARNMGYDRIITYTQANESGASLRAAGFVRVRELPPRKSWAESTADERLKGMRDSVGNGGVGRVLWEIRREQSAQEVSMAKIKTKSVQIDAALHAALTAMVVAMPLTEDGGKRVTLRDVVDAAIREKYPQLMTDVADVVTTSDSESAPALFARLLGAAFGDASALKGSVAGSFGQTIELSDLARYIAESMPASATLEELIKSYEREEVRAR